jgi:hypothetical protein
VVVGEALPDGGGADRGVLVDHRVDDGVEAVQGCRFPMDFPPLGWRQIQ